ncbi:MAG TPA: rRNA methyltransferase [Algoriphagus sp.]|jgi:tRNA (guanosine-2'-O-)-methyltransferase|uniref:TrmH family RNA methyltransferase n=1 Tax=unclassified Algoriphagus TaxID=2641541 RepID=UPI000C603C5B|nr:MULTISPECIES: RNA methyltransferase [unclassified Algoriphagus]MAL13249.1 rRNA methyltransferase [Algoriphagus sp.]HAD51369.1 rRNA methyltransferase [Algoriphagus sp.]HAS57843.1 rRNA methyltransferase [Algoriphagus sp.]HAZ23587.1 rRNA methyltransferase [Algoriphagus sp.]HCB45072.1 rRNA methyltransferase [Algoriphagus sp.]|tara:strand:+ start:5549 stop:6250 length:702 start_codon:yes stop_codon:yes gene_type:complete
MEEKELYKKELGLLSYLGQYITDHKKKVMETVLAQRTRFFTVVLEDIYKPHNASAVLRTCDCFGIQDVHIIEKTNQYKVNPYVTRGASDWVDIHKYFSNEGNAVKDCFSALKKNGYQIFATSPNPGSISVYDLPANQKIALVFGNEHEGVSEEVKQQADGLVHIPMLGFTESFNISVSASIFLYELTKQIKDLTIEGFHLSEDEKHALRLKWYKQIVKRSDLHEKMYWETLNS